MKELEYLRKYNPEGSALRKAQLQMLEMIKYLDAICKENHITYFLDGGSTLGAIRHKGFIPWDDDMDIVLFKKDYKRLCKILLATDSHDYVLQCQQTDSNYVDLFPKFRMRKGDFRGTNPNRSKLYKWRGIGIDVFCIQETSYMAAFISAGIRRKLLGWTWKISNGFLRFCTTKLLFALYYFCYPLYLFLGLFRKKGEMHYSLGQGWPNTTYSKDWFKEAIYAPFEDTCLPVPVDYESVLCASYGDWRQIPSEEQIAKFGIHSKDLLTK